MKTLMSELNDEIQTRNISIRKLAKSIGSSRTTVSNGLQNVTVEMKFDIFVKLVHYVYKNAIEATRQIHRFIKLCKSSLNIRKALSYCQVAGEYGIMEELLKRFKDEKDLKKYITVYSLYNQRNKNEKRGQKLLDEIYDMEISMDHGCQVLLNTLLMAGEYDKQRYSAMLPYVHVIENYLAKMDKGYIKDCLEMQYKERMAYIQLHANEIKSCRSTCQSILDSDLDFTVVKATALCCLGESYVFENPLMAETYIQKAIESLEGISSPKGTQKYASFKTTLAFLYIEYGFNLEKIDFDFINDGDLAYYECLYGDKEKGYEIFNKLEKEEGLSAFQMYYLSRVNDDTILMSESLELFEKMGNLMYAQLAKRALITEGVL